MPTVKLNISLDREVAETLRRRAAELNKPASRYLADLIREEDQRHQDELAAEGYRLLSSDTAEFTAAAWPLAVELWPPWDDEDACSKAESGVTEGRVGEESHTQAG